MSERPTHSWLQIGLTISVAINLLLVGGLIGRALAPEPLAPTEIRNLQDVQRLQSPDGNRTRLRRAARGQLFEAWQATAAARGEVDAARTQLIETIRATPYDEPAVAAALATMRKAEARLKSDTHAQLITTLSQTPPEQRGALADMLLRQQRERPRPRRRNRRREPSAPR